MRRTETVQAVMTNDPVTVGLDTPFKDIAELLADCAISAVPVVNDEGVPIGIVSEADLLAKAEYQGQPEPPSWFAGPQRRHGWEKAQALTAAELMSPRPLAISPDTPLPRAAGELSQAGVRRLLVVDGSGRLIGVVARRDMLRPYLRDDEQIQAEIRHEILERALWLRPADLDVTVNDGVVTLAGTLEQRSQAEIAVRLTHALPGVIAVEDRLEYRFDDIAAKLPTSNLLH